MFLARILGVSEFGLYTVALAYFSIISAIADFGFNRYLIREAATDRSKVAVLLWNIILLRLTLTAVLFAVFAVNLYLLDTDKARVSLILLAALAILPQAIAFTFDAIFVGLQKLQFSAISLFVASLTTAGTGFVLVSQGFGSIGAVNALIIGQVVYAVFLFIFLIKNEKLVLTDVKFELIKDAIKGSLPYGILGVLGLLYFRIDAILLSYIKGSFETGIYGAAYKFLESLIFIPSAFSLALFPILARSHESSPGNLKRLYFKSLKIMLLVSLVIAAGYVFILPEIIQMFLPNYLPSIGAIKILSLSIPFMFIHVPAVSILLSTDKYLKPIILFSILTLSFNIITNLIFIPSYGYIAAAWITTFSEMLSFAVFFWLVKIKVLDTKS